MATLRLGGLADGLAVRDAHGNEARLDAGLGLHAVEHGVNLGFAQRVNERLMRLVVALDAQRRVGVRSAGQERAHLVLFVAVRSLDGNRIERLRQRERVDGHVALCGERVARLRVGELRDDHDVACLRRLHVRGLLAHHDADLADAVLFARAGVDELLTRLEHAGDDLDEAQAADIGVGHGLEHEEARVAFGGDHGLFAVGEAEAAVRSRAREVGGDVFHEALDALLDDGGAHVHRDEELLGDGLVQQAFQLFLGELLFALQILHHELVVSLCHLVAELVARSLGGILVFGRNLVDDFAAVDGVVARLHAQDVDNALEVFVHADRNGDRAQAGAEARVQHGHGGVEIGVFAVNMVDEHGSAKSHVLRFAPQLVVHDLRACHGVDHEQRGLGGLHGRQGVAQEVRLARRVDQVDLEVLVRDGRQRGADGEAAADLFVVVIQVRFPVVRGAHAGRFAGDVEHGLSERGLARAVLAYKHDVSYMFGSGSCHGEPPTFLLCGQVPCHLLRAKGTVLCRALHKQNNGESVSHFPRAAVGDRSHSRVSRRNLKRERRHAHGSKQMR